jgi:hypothetical protein
MTKSERHKSFFNLVNDKLYRKAGVGVGEYLYLSILMYNYNIHAITVEFNLEGANVGDQRFENDIGYSPYYYIDGKSAIVSALASVDHEHVFNL